MKIKQAIILAAGLGQRMRPLSNDRPKPMVEVGGRPMIDYALEALAQHGITHCVVNTHYKAEVLETHLKEASWPFKITISHEPDLLDTGGGLKQCLGFLDRHEPVFVLSGDSILLDTPQSNALASLENAWNDETTDILISLQPLDTMVITKGIGDYTLQNNKPVRTPDHSGQYMWNSARIIHPRIFENTSSKIFSFLPMLDDAQNKGRLAAIINSGIWHHLSTPEDVTAVNAAWVKA